MIVSRPETSGLEAGKAENVMRPEDLHLFAGMWVAQAADGTRIVAIGKDLVELDRRIIESGEDPEKVLLLRVPDSQMVFSGAEFQ